MVDMRVPERSMADRSIVRLSPSARHDYWSLMLLSISMRTDGDVEAADLTIIPWGVQEGSFSELERQGLLVKKGKDRWFLTRYEADQTAAQELEAMAQIRNYERIKKARTRAKTAGMPDDEIDKRFPLITSESPGRVRGHAEDRPEPEPELEPGRDEGEVDVATGEVKDWPTKAPPDLCRHGQVSSACFDCGLTNIEDLVASRADVERRPNG